MTLGKPECGLACIELDAAGRIVLWEEPARRLFRRSGAEAVGQSLALLFPPPAPVPSQVRALLRQAAQQGWLEQEGWWQRGDGSRYWGRVLLEAGPTGASFRLYAADLSAAHHAGAVLEAELGRTRGVLESLPQGVLVFRPDGHLASANPAACRLFGESAARLAGRSYSDARWELYRPEGGPAGEAGFGFLAVVRTGAPVAGLEFLRGADGERLWAAAAPLLDPAAPGGVVVTLHDETRRYWGEAAREAQSGLRSRSWRLLEREADERRRLAEEIHDDLGQMLTGLKLLLRRLLAGDERPEAREARRAAEAVHERVRKLAQDLRPGVLDELGLDAALASLCRRFAAQTGLPVEYRAEGRPPRCRAIVETTVYRIAQEALMNAARHSGAGRVEVRLAATPELLRLRVADTGVGFDPEGLPGNGSGLLGMQDRALLLGGCLELEAEPGTGCMVTLSLPLTTIDLTT